MDRVDYQDRVPWPVGADGGGVSLAKQDPYWTSRDAANWAASDRVGGSPGQSNQPEFDPTPIVTPVIKSDTTWSYRADGVDQGTAWRQSAFNDRDWQRAPAIFWAGEEAIGGERLEVEQLDGAGDADLRAAATYTHLLDFGNADSGAEINSLEFTPVNASALLSASTFTWQNSSGLRTHGTAGNVLPLDGPLRELMQDYVSNALHRADGTAGVTLVGLEPGTRYRTRLYARRADANPREVTLQFAHGTALQTISLDQNSPDIADPNEPYVVTYEFEATSSELQITAIQHAGNRPWLWYGLSNEVVQQTGTTQLPLGPTTAYFRSTFDYRGDMRADHEMRLQLTIDDGAVVYLNGVEIHRDNLPAGPVTYSTLATDNVVSSQRRDVVVLPAEQLRFDGPNVLAVEVHQAANGNPDVRFGAQLSVVASPRPPVTPPSLRLNELPAAGDSPRFVELINLGDTSVALDQVVIQWRGTQTRALDLPNVSIAPGSVLSVPIANEFPAWQSQDHLFLYSADGSALVDAQVLDDRPQARSWEHQGRWLVPARLTPNLPNEFSVSDAIVINEIMYHAAPQFATGDVPFVESTEEWIELYNRSASSVDVSGWELGGGVDFRFPSGTSIPANGYLVISNDAQSLRQKWPDVTILGNHQRSLGNAGDLIVLRDTNGNPVDEVQYYDKGTWPVYADGGGSSLELMDPFADNRRPEAWAASSERDGAPWVTITYEGTARPPQGSADPAEWNELILGLLDAGEILLDDISVIEDPAGTAIERMQNGAFEQGDAHWRFVGNHGQHGQTRVIVDPQDPSNHVLHVVATGATEHMSNHLETTFVDNAAIVSNRTYRISFKARWLAGSPQLNTRLYFNRLAATHILPQPVATGTPGQPNSQRIQNAGPTFDGLKHDPPVPQPGQPVAVEVRIADVDEVDVVTLYYSRAGRAFEAVPMVRGDGDTFASTIPGFLAGEVVQFYVEARDGKGAIAQYPAGGPDSRALYRVNEGAATTGPRHNLRIIMTSDDLNEQFTRTNFTSNQRMGATVIWRETQVYYNVQVRLKGSGFSRGSSATGFNLRFSPDQLLFGEHDVVAIDRQGGPWGPGASHRELTIKHIANRAGDIPMMYDDVIHMVGPRDNLNGSGQLLVARYDDVFLESQYENGGEGTRFKYELIYYSTLTVDGNPESLKLAPGSARSGVFPVRGVDMPYMGDDADAYRWYYLIRNNRDRDDFSAIIALNDALRSSSSAVGGTLDQLTQQTMDVDQWMRLFAFQSLAGINDTFNQGLQHNLQFYVRPSDQRVIALPWDMDHSLHQPTTMGIYGTGSRLTRVINIPTNRRVFQQHLLDIIETSYNEEYLQPWVAHLATRAEQNVTSEIMSYVRSRRAFVLGRLDAEIPFEITTPGKDSLVVDSAHVTLEGKGWIDVREIQLDGQPLPVEWIDGQTWRALVPLKSGTQTVTLTAVNLRGQAVGTAQATITTSVIDPLRTGLRVTELNYHPSDPVAAELQAGWTDPEAFEFVELTNVSEHALRLSGVKFVRQAPDGSSSGIGFSFPDVELPAGGSVVIVQDTGAFAARYGSAVVPLGEYEGRLSNGGERLRLVGPGDEVIQEFAYDDEWFASTDGGGATLETRAADVSDRDAWGNASIWRASRDAGGTPGFAPRPDFNRDGQLTALDIDLLCAAIADADSTFDLSGDRRVDERDVVALVVDAMGSQIGDVNLDGVFNSSDLVLIFQRGEYEDLAPRNSTYITGDWNCDGDFTSRDLVFAFQQGGYRTGI
jgi:hypothetical protein